MRDSVPIARYSSICSVLRLWRISLIPTYRVYRLYDSMIVPELAQMKKKEEKKKRGGGQKAIFDIVWFGM